MRFFTKLISFSIIFLFCRNKNSIGDNLNCTNKIVTDSVFIDTIFSEEFHAYPFYELFSYSIRYDSLFKNKKITLGNAFREFEGFSHEYYLNGKLFKYTYSLGYTDKSIFDKFAYSYSKNIRKIIETKDAFACVFSNDYDSQNIKLDLFNFTDSLHFLIVNNSPIEFDDEYIEMLYCNLKSFKKIKFETESQRSECINNHFKK